MASRIRQGARTTAVGYIRVSTEDQRLGPEAQRASITTWAKREGVQIVAWYTDQGVSGAAPIDQRPGLGDALAALKTHKAGALVVAKRDRLARDVVVAVLIERAATAMGARVVSADGTGNGDEPGDAFMRTIIDAAAAYERALIRSRTKAALQAKQAKGERTGGVPYGSALAADGVHLVPVAAEQRVIRKVRQLRARGLTLRAVVEELEAADVVARNGRPFQLTQIARILSRAARTTNLDATAQGKRP